LRDWKPTSKMWKAEVHEAALEMQVRVERVDRQHRREFHHADQHQRRDLAGAARHREDQSGHDAGHRARQHHAADGLPFRGPAGEGAFPHRPRHRRERLLGGDDDDRHRQQRQGQRRPENAAGPNVGLGSRSA
jgi:hypothetical protein